MTYPICYVDEGLSVSLLKTVYHIGRVPIRKNFPDEGGEFFLGDGVADQPLQCLLVGVDSDGWIGGVVRTT